MLQKQWKKKQISLQVSINNYTAIDHLSKICIIPFDQVINREYDGPKNGVQILTQELQTFHYCNIPFRASYQQEKSIRFLTGVIELQTVTFQ